MDSQDIHNKTWEQRVFERTRPETVELAKRRSEFVETAACPACHEEPREFACEVFGMQPQRCLNCQTLYISPCPTDAHIMEYLTTSEGMRIWREEMPEETKNSRKSMYIDRLNGVLAASEEFDVKPGIVLEVGGGSGEFAREVASRNAFGKLIIAEPQPLELDLPRTEVVAGGFDDVQLSEPADFVLAYEVFEHLVEPDRFLSFAMRNLRPGGLLLMTTPNIEGFEGFALGDKSYTIPFDHVRLYNPRSMDIVLSRNGFEVLEIETPGKLDFDQVSDAYKRGEVDVSRNPALKFILDNGERFRDEFQQFLCDNRMSGHMKSVARKALI